MPNLRGVFLILCVFATTVGSAAESVLAGMVPVTVAKTVSARSGPWDPGLPGNAGLFYGEAPYDGLPPTLFTTTDGFNFNAGDIFTIAYAGGLTSHSSGEPPAFDGLGDPNSPIRNNLPGISGNGLPSQHIYSFWFHNDVYQNALVGAFANSLGEVIGTPFVVGNGPKVIMAPLGATRLQLGINDENFSDNSGSLDVQVCAMGSTPVPVPGTITLFGIGMCSLLGFRWLTRKAATVGL
jgi:hypothetical protein